MSYLLKRRSLPFKFTLYLLTLLTALFIVVVTWYSNDLRSKLDDYHNKRLFVASQLLTEKFNHPYQTFYQLNAGLMNIAQDATWQDSNNLQLVERLARLDIPFKPLFFLNADGKIESAAGKIRLPFEVSSLNEQIVTGSRPDNLWSSLIYTPDLETWSQFFYQKVIKNEQFIGYWVFVFDLDKHIQLVKAAAKKHEFSFFVYNADHQLIYHPDYGAKLIRQSEIYNSGNSKQQLVRQSVVEFMKSTPSLNNLEKFSDWGLNHYAIRSQLAVKGWTMVVFESERVVAREVSKSSFQLSTILLFCILPILLLFFILSYKTVSKRLRELARMVTRADMGEWREMQVIDGSDEIDHVINNFNKHVQQVDEPNEQLHKQQQYFLEEIEEYKGLAQAASFSDNAVVMLELDYTISFVDAQGVNLMRKDREQLIGSRFFNHIHPYMAFLPEQMINDIRRNQSWRGELVLQGQREDIQIWVNTTITPMRNEAGEVTKYVVSLQDISFIKDSESKIEQLAYTDELTGLANRSFFKAQLEKLVEMNKREHYEFVLLHLDIDDFKRINDTYGYEGGDELIKQIAERLKKNLRSEDVIARIAGDEFALILGGIDSEQKVLVMINHILSWLADPYDIKDKQMAVSCSIGLTMSKNDDANAELLLQHANMAMYEAKSIGKNTFHFFTAELNEMVKERVSIERELKNAIIKGELQLYFQPKVNVEELEHIGFEALLRWYNPDLGHIGPDKFIPIAEQSTLILELSEWVMDKACLFIKKMEQPVPVSINLSAKQFEAGNSADMIAQALKRHEIPPELIEVEITETELMSDVESAISQLEQLKSLGIAISIDDFGTGYASLNYLKRFPLDTIKIDRTFISDIPDDKSDMEITSAIIAISDSLGLKVIAEGVETAEQLEALLANGCTQIQGYFFSQPLPEHEALNWQLKTNWAQNK